MQHAGIIHALHQHCKKSTMLRQGIVWMIPACCTIEAFKCLQAVQMFHVYDVSAIVLHILHQLQTVHDISIWLMTAVGGRQTPHPGRNSRPILS